MVGLLFGRHFLGDVSWDIGSGHDKLHLLREYGSETHANPIQAFPRPVRGSGMRGERGGVGDAGSCMDRPEPAGATASAVSPDTPSAVTDDNLVDASRMAFSPRHQFGHGPDFDRFLFAFSGRIHRPSTPPPRPGPVAAICDEPPAGASTEHIVYVVYSESDNLTYM